jgi:hypothetical protein
MTAAEQETDESTGRYLSHAEDDLVVVGLGPRC